MLLDETYFEESNINRKPFISSQDKIITKFCQKKMGQFGFGKSVQKLPKNSGQVSFEEAYFEEININRKPLIWSQDKIITKFGPNNRRVLFCAKCTKIAQILWKSVI